MKLKQSQIALSNYPYFKHSWSYTLRSLQRLGAEAIELYACDPHFHIDDSGLPEAKALKMQLKQHGLRAICLTPEQVKYPINIASSNPICRERSVQTYVRCLEFAHELEIPIVQFFAGFGALDEEYAHAWQRSVESLSYLAKIAEGYGLIITIEAAEPIYTVLTDTSKISNILNEVDSQALMGMIDTLCLVACGEDIDTAIQNIGPKNLRHIHFSDAFIDRSSTDHIIPGEGTMDLDAVLDSLSSVDYQHYIALELMTPYEYHPEEAMKQGYDWLLSRTN